MMSRWLTLFGNDVASRREGMVTADPHDALGGLAELFECSPDGILLIDEDGAIVVANAQLHRFFGYADGSLTGRSLEVLLPERARGAHASKRRAFQEAPVSRRMGTSLRLQGLRSDGHEVPVDIALASVTLGGASYSVAFVRDMTEWQTLVADLEESKRRLALDVEDRREYRAMTELLQAMRTQAELSAALGATLQRVLVGTSGWVGLLDDARQHIGVVTSWGTVRQDTFAFDECLACERLIPVESGNTDGRCQHVHDVAADYCCHPLLAEGRVIGVLHLRAENPGAMPHAAVPARARRRASEVAERIATPLLNASRTDRLTGPNPVVISSAVCETQQAEHIIRHEFERARRLGYSIALAFVAVLSIREHGANSGPGYDRERRLLGAYLAKRLGIDARVLRIDVDEFAIVLPGADASTEALVRDIVREWNRRSHEDIASVRIGQFVTARAVAASDVRTSGVTTAGQMSTN
ncbi:MAG: PAS domain S-box protein [Vicinamibacterales bacterium]